MPWVGGRTLSKEITTQHCIVHDSGIWDLIGFNRFTLHVGFNLGEWRYAEQRQVTEQMSVCPEALNFFKVIQTSRTRAQLDLYMVWWTTRAMFIHEFTLRQYIRRSVLKIVWLNFSQEKSEGNVVWGLMLLKWFLQMRMDYQSISPEGKGRHYHFIIYFPFSPLFCRGPSLLCIWISPNWEIASTQFSCLWKHKFPRACNEFIFGTGYVVHPSPVAKCLSASFPWRLVPPSVSIASTDWFALKWLPVLGRV